MEAFFDLEQCTVYAFTAIILHYATNGLQIHQGLPISYELFDWKIKFFGILTFASLLMTVYFFTSALLTPTSKDLTSALEYVISFRFAFSFFSITVGFAAVTHKAYKNRLKMIFGI